MKEYVKYVISIVAVLFAAFLYGVDEQMSLGTAMISLLFLLYVILVLFKNENKERTCYILLFVGGVFISSLWDSYYVVAVERYYLAAVLLVLMGVYVFGSHGWKLAILSVGVCVILALQLFHSGISVGLMGFGPKLVALIFTLPVEIMLLNCMTEKYERAEFLLAYGFHAIHLFLESTSTYWILSLVLYLGGLSLIYVDKKEVKKNANWIWIIPGICALGLTMLRGEDVNYYCAGAWNLIMKVVGVV